jgi:hypothetical protein
MKALIHVLCVAGVVLFRPVRAVGAEEDPRFVAGNAGTENAYMDGFADVILKAYGRAGWKLRGLEGVHKVGGVHVVSGFVTLDDIADPVTEKDFARLEEFFEPFILKQMEACQRKGMEVVSRSNGYPLPAHAKGYMNNRLPTMAWSLSGVAGDLFHMSVTFSERKDDHLVVRFTIVAVP